MKKHLSHEPDGMYRRDFLALSATAVAGIAATGASASTSGALTVLKGTSPVLSVGFAELDSVEGGRVLSADRLPIGDSQFHENGARLTVHGLWRPEQRLKNGSISLTTFFDVDGQRLPYIAWSGNTGAPVSFRVPVDADGGIRIGIERNSAPSILREPARRFASIFRTAESQAAPDVPQHDALEQKGSVCRLATNGSGLKLRRGTYFIALRTDGWDARPDWSSLSLAGDVRNVKGQSVLRRGGHAVDFEYLVVSVDHA